MIAARKGSVEIVRTLVQHGASVNHTNKVSYNSFQSVTCHTNVSRECMLVFLLVLELAFNQPCWVLFTDNCVNITALQNSYLCSFVAFS